VQKHISGLLNLCYTLQQRNSILCRLSLLFCFIDTNQSNPCCPTVPGNEKIDSRIPGNESRRQGMNALIIVGTVKCVDAFRGLGSPCNKKPAMCTRPLTAEIETLSLEIETRTETTSLQSKEFVYFCCKTSNQIYKTTARFPHNVNVL